MYFLKKNLVNPKKHAFNLVEDGTVLQAMQRKQQWKYINNKKRYTTFVK